LGRLTLVAWAVFAASSAAAVQGGPAATPNDPRPRPLVLDDVPEVLVPRRTRTEAEEDRLKATALFSAGRSLERKQKYAEALQCYQRAVRYDGEAATVARNVLTLAFGLRRREEAARYAQRMEPADLRQVDHRLLRFLGIHLTGKAEWPQAVKLYEAAVAARAEEPAAGDSVVLRMELSRLYHLCERYEEAADGFADVVEALEHPKEHKLTDEHRRQILLGKPALTQTLFGECFLQARRPDDALAAFRAAHQAEPDEGLWQFNQAQVHAKRGKPAKALAALRKCSEEHLASEGIGPCELLSEVLEDLGRGDELLAQLEKLRQDDPDNVPLAYYLAGKYFEAEAFDKAEPLYRRLAEKSPTPVGQRNLAQIYRQTNRPAELLATLGSAVGVAGTLEILGDQGKAMVEDRKLVETLVKAGKDQVAADPDAFDFGSRYAVALLALETEQFDVAAEFFELALKAKPDDAAELFLTWGLGLLIQDRAADAVGVFQRAIDEKVLPDGNPAFHHYLARAASLAERTDEAVAAIRKAIELDEDSPRYQGLLGWILFRADRNDEAAAAFGELVEKFDSQHDSPETRELLREARLTLSHLAVLCDELPAAEEWLEQVLDEFPGDVGASNDLGYLWADEGKHLNRSLAMITLAVDAEPENVAYRDSLGWIYYRLGRFDEAVAELEKAVRLQAETDDEPDATILDHLGDAYLGANQPDKARDSWQRAVAAFDAREEPEEAKRVREKLKQK